jgi:hypothetical protein
MKLFGQLITLTFFITLLIGGITKAEVKAQTAQKISALLTLMNNHRQQLKSLKSNVEITTLNAPNNDKTTFQGSLICLFSKEYKNFTGTV